MRTPWAIFRFVAALALLLALSPRARAALADDMGQFLADHDALTTLREKMATTLATLATDVSTAKDPTSDITTFLTDRNTLITLRIAKAEDRKAMRASLGKGLSKIANPVKRKKDLAQDAASYIASYDLWVSLRQPLADCIEQMRAALAANDAAAQIASVENYFNTSLARHEARLQWQLDILALKRDVKFKPKGKRSPPSGATIAEITVDFVADRAFWEDLGAILEADRSNIRATLNTPESLEATVITFLTDRRTRHVGCREMALDLDLIAKLMKIRGGIQDRKSNTAVPKDQIDADEEDDALGQSPDDAGEK